MNLQTIVTLICVLMALSIQNFATTTSEKKKSAAPKSSIKKQSVKPDTRPLELEQTKLQQFQKEAEALSKKMETLAQKCIQKDTSACDQLQKDTTTMLNLSCKYNLASNSCSIAAAREKKASECGKKSIPLHQCFNEIDESNDQNEKKGPE